MYQAIGALLGTLLIVVLLFSGCFESAICGTGAKMHRTVGFFTPGIIAIYLYFRDCAPWSFQRKAELDAILAKVNPLIAKKVSHAFVISMADIIKLDAWPKHEQALASGILKRVEIKSPPGRRAPMFISHKWQGHNPDENNKLFGQVKKYLKNITPETVKALGGPDNFLFWFDYTCAPQDDATERSRHLAAIPDILQKFMVRPIVEPQGYFSVDDETRRAYECSIWCQLEFIATILPLKAIPNRQWSITDKLDLYEVLPGFIAMACSPRKRSEFLSDDFKASTFCEILRVFIAYHDEHGV